MINLLTHHSVFSGFLPEEMQQFKEIVSIRTAKAREIIFEIDDTPDNIYYLVDGALNLLFPDNSRIHITPVDLIGEIGVLNGDFRLGKLVAETDSTMIAISTQGLFDQDMIAPGTSLQIIRRLSKRVTNYLRAKQQISSRELLEAGENEHIEFKSTLRWNMNANKKDTNITYAVLKTVAAFLNSDGGTLFVGVNDDGKVLGLEPDQFESNDKLLLFVTNVIKSNIGPLFINYIHYHLERIRGKIVLRVDVQASADPCYLQDGNTDHFYIRTGPATTDLKLSEVYDYVRKRFG